MTHSKDWYFSQSLCLDSGGSGHGMLAIETAKANLFRKSGSPAGVASNACYPNIPEVEAGGSRIPGQMGLFHETPSQRRNANSQAPPRPAENTGLCRDHVPWPVDFPPHPGSGAGPALLGRGEQEGPEERQRDSGPLETLTAGFFPPWLPWSLLGAHPLYHKPAGV